jgi:hypothetical protein
MPASENQGWCRRCQQYVLIRKQLNAVTNNTFLLLFTLVFCFPLAVIVVPLIFLNQLGDSVSPYRCTKCGGPTPPLASPITKILALLTIPVSLFIGVSAYRMTAKNEAVMQQQQVIAQQIEAKRVQFVAKQAEQAMIEVPKKLAVGQTAKIKSSNSEGFVRLFKTREFFDRWQAATQAKDQAELLRISGDKTEPVFSAGDGESVTVIAIDGKCVEVKVTTGPNQDRVGFIAAADLDAGTERVPATPTPAPAPAAK